jgi:hypothetical protein
MREAKAEKVKGRAQRAEVGGQKTEGGQKIRSPKTGTELTAKGRKGEGDLKV